jgi:hypothetical protein
MGGHADGIQSDVAVQLGVRIHIGQTEYEAGVGREL